MRLLNTETLELEFFFDKEVPEYAILSHTWGKGEVSFQALGHDVHVSDRLGYVKLQQSCELAASMNLGYVWIDTCCIDKSSSAELSEAINSMFRWYAKSTICIAFLPDVPPSTDSETFRQSRWFTRGWTLQELIAPQEVVFYNQDWTRLGTRASLKKDIQVATGIPEDIFEQPLNLDSLDQLEKLKGLSVAEKMRWAAKRQTTRAEDIAYCLMGIFEINMPLLYGEGQEKAFKRLQEEIIKATDDESIYAWCSPEGTPTEVFRGLLADSPANFENSGGSDDLNDLLPKRSRYLTRRSGLSTVMTNRGIHLELPLSPLPTDESGTIYLAFLDCEMRRGQASLNPAILLQRTSWDNDAHFVRIRPDMLVLSLMNNIILPDELLQILAESKTKPFEEAITRQIFVPHDEPEIRYPKGIIFHPRIRCSEESPYRVEVCSRSPTWQLFHQEATRQSSPTESYEINFDLAPAPLVEELTEPKVLGALELYVEAIYGSQPLTICLVTGLEPLPPNPFGTPSLYFTPWYAFEEKAEVAKGDFAGALDKTRRKDRLQLLHTLTASFELESKYSRLFYSIMIQVDESNANREKRSRWF
ncbi:Fc.00g065010.m01.CDS01 [Cosmosporella sp. VM-42]